MLTIFPIKSVTKTVDYFQEQDNYYAKEGELSGKWFGKGAELLNLKKEVTPENFIAALEGKLSPEIKMEKTTEKRRFGYDLTFSAPKSVSILALIGKDERVLNAHKEAVDETLKHIEKHYATTRIKGKSKTSIAKTDNLLIAKFEHIESRELDPQLHTHSIVMNATCRHDQKWRTVFFDEIYNDKKLLDAIYMGKLVQKLMLQGYEITITSEKASFELKGFPELPIKQFSKRRQQIVVELEKEGLSGGKAAQIANFNTRKDKQKMDLKELEANWLNELQSCGVDLKWLKDYSAKAAARGPVTMPNPYELANKALTIALGDLSKWQATFTTKQLLKTARGFSIANFSPMLLEKALAEQFKTGQLLYLKDDLCTTQANRDLEIANILNMRQGKNKIFPMFTKLAAAYVANKTAEKLEVKLILKEILTNTDRQMAVISETTTLYAEVMQPLVKLANEYGFYPIGITQTVKRIEPFTKELGSARVQTLAGFLMSCETRAEQLQNPRSAYKLAHAKQIWIFDLAANIPVVEINVLQKYAEIFGARIIWACNSKKSFAAINALIQRGIKQCNLAKNSVKNISALMDHPKFTNLVNNFIDPTDWQKNTASTLIHWLIVKYQERNAVFSLKDLQLELFSLGLTVPKEVLQTQLELELKQSLVKVTDQLVTTKDTIALEQTCLKLVATGKGTQIKIMDSVDIKLPKRLTEGQKQAINLVLTTNDRVVGIQGVAGAGKTTMLRSLNKLCLAAGFEIIGLATATSARERLQSGSKDLTGINSLLKAGVKAFTTQKFLINSEKLLTKDYTLAQLEYGNNKIFVLDESSFASTAEMFAVLTKMEQLNTRLIVMGDHSQLPSVAAGRIFYLMLGSSMQSVAMTENVRFKSTKTLKVMQHIYNNKIKDALRELGNSIIEIPDHQERLATMAKLYLQRILEKRDDPILITPENSDRKIVNHEIRQGLKVSGQLKGLEIDCHNLTKIELTIAEQQKIYYFKEQALIYFSKATDPKIKVSNYYQIRSKNLEDRTLVLEDFNTKKQIIWSPERQPGILTLYRQESRSLMEQDQIRWLKNDELRGICNGQIATVLTTKGNGYIEVKLQNGKQIPLDLNQLANQHWDHAYAATAHAAQGLDRQAIGLGKGGYHKEIMTKDLKVGKVIMIKNEPTEANKNLIKSKWVTILAISKDYTATVQDCSKATFTIDLKKSPIDLYSKGQAIWYSYSDPETRKNFEIPKLTSVEEFLVSVTRGDNVILLVDHLESYLHTLEQKLSNKRSALEFLAPNREEVKNKVQNMIKNITGRAKSETKDNDFYVKDDNKVKNLERHSLYKRENFVTIEQVIDKLHSNILLHTTNWLGNPQKTTGIEARWGNKGSLVVKLSGTKAGYWHDFEANQGGKNLLSLYINKFNIDFKTAMDNLAKELNIYNDPRLFAKSSPIKKVSINNQEQPLALLTQNKINYARETYNKAVPITNTLAEKYLREFRGIQGPIPEDFRFCAKLKHPDLNRMLPALLAPIKDPNNEIKGIVRVFLNNQGNKLNASYVDSDGKKQQATIKANLGSMNNAAVIINQAKCSGIVYIAEGIETALSIAETKRSDPVIAALSVSNLKNVPLPVGAQKVILCADNDGINACSNKILNQAAKCYLERGLQVAIAYPENIKGMTKIDFNDVLKKLSTGSIEKSLQQAIPQTLSTVTKTIESNSSKEIQHLPTITTENKTKELSL